MGSLEKIIAVENEHIGPEPKASLGRAFDLAKREWQTGNHDREIALHLIFLFWYCNVEPAYLTGYSSRKEDSGLFVQAYTSLADSIEDDVEALYVLGLMAHIAPWVFGEVREWDARSVEYREKYRKRCPNGIDPGVFLNRGAYGEYFQGQATIQDGY